MSCRIALVAFATVAAALLAPEAAAEKQTVCTITVNSADEREVFRASLPADRFDFVELVERGRRDWLRSACARGVRCDVLVVSGHFAGTEFYSSRPGMDESLRVDEIERAQCSDACPGLFGGLKEVYLFGCDSLKAEPVKDHGEASRDVMRRLFAGTPVIYGFTSLAPYGRVAGPMLRRHFAAAGVSEVGTGEASARLLALFGPSSMVATAALARDDPRQRPLACRFLDERVPAASRLDAIAEALADEPPAMLAALERIESFLAGDHAPAAAPAGSAPHRERFLETMRAVADPALRLRLIAVARRMHWLTPEEDRTEVARLVAALLESATLAHGDVDLICRLNTDRALDALADAAASPARLGHAAAHACLGSDDARSRVLRALSAPDDADVLLAQAYFRHRPIDEVDELRLAAARVAAMAAGPAQVRALETLARFHVSDADTLDRLARLFQRTTSLAVQRAIAEVFVRAGDSPQARDLAELLRRHRRPSERREDLIDAAIRRLEAS